MGLGQHAYAECLGRTSSKKTLGVSGGRGITKRLALIIATLQTAAPVEVWQQPA
jgi:hypothetical protein